MSQAVAAGVYSRAVPPAVRTAIVLAAAAGWLAAGCADRGSALRPMDDLAPLEQPDLTFHETDDIAVTDDLPMSLDLCGDQVADPACVEKHFGDTAPLPLRGDGGASPQQGDEGLRLDRDGWLVLDGASSGSYTVIVAGCGQGGPFGYPDTGWYGLAWESDVPAGTKLVVQAKTGASSDPADASWKANRFTPPASTSPLDLTRDLCPNLSSDCEPTIGSYYLQVRFSFDGAAGVSPRLRSFAVGYKCPI